MRKMMVSLLAMPLFVGAAMAQEADPFADAGWDEFEEWPEEQASSNFTYAGFIEFAAGNRLANDPALGRAQTLRDARVQLQMDYALSTSSINFRGDVYYDGILDSVETQLRELVWQGNLAALGVIGEKFDLKIGQQVLTWGTGDYVFLNDLFPKDYQSFFAGRDDEYLKAPSLSAKLSGYFGLFNMDLVYTPEFEPDNGINGEYFSFFSPMAGGNVAPEFDVLDENHPDDAEWALRLYRTVSDVELAGYVYRGFDKTPLAADNLGQPRYSRLNVFGASAITPFGDGLLKAEYAYHDAVENDAPQNPFEPNSQSRFLVGYEQELIANLTGSVQWYLEHTHDYGDLIANSPWPGLETEQNRHVVTTQLMYRAMQQTLTLQWFNFYSPTDEDGYSRIKATYSPVDQWQVNGGLNLFYGDKPHTFYRQFEDASNFYLAFRYFY